MSEELLNQLKKGLDFEDHPKFTPLLDEIDEYMQKKYKFYSSEFSFEGYVTFEAFEALKKLSEDEKIEMFYYLIKRTNAWKNKTRELRFQMDEFLIKYHTRLEGWGNFDNEEKAFEVINSKWKFCLGRICSLNDAVLNRLIANGIDFTENFSFKACFEMLYPQASIRLDESRFAALVLQIEKHIKKYGLSENLTKDILTILNMPAIVKCLNAKGRRYEPDIVRAIKKLHNLLHSENEKGEQVILPYQLGTGRFGSIISADLSAMPNEQKNQWNALFHHLATATAGKPTQKFLTLAHQLIEAIGIEEFKNQAIKWLDAAVHLTITIESHTETYSGGREYTWHTYEFVENYSFDLLKGLLWTVSQFCDAHALQIIAQLAEKCFQKIPGKGPVAASIGNAGIYALATAQGLEGISHLSRLKLRIKQNNTQKLIQQYLEEQAKKRGIKASQIEELAVSDYGLVNGERIEAFEDYQLVLRLTGVGACELQWLKPDGKPQKTTPAFVTQNEDLANQYKQLKETAKQVKQASSVQRDRIDRLYIENLRWNFADFTAYYLNHGLVSQIARKLIWSLDEQPALFVEGQWQDETGNSVKLLEKTQIKLWHPIDSKAETVLAWRDRLETLQIQQPFKQAYREIYLLTDAEVNTRVYSNRMAAHILKQHQFNSLAALRGWKYSLLGAYDDGRDNEIAKKPLPEYGLMAQFWIDEILDGNDSFNDTGIWNYVATDQVRFCNAEGNEVVPLMDVPPLIFSEIMRDVDLFVGVASVGNDPQWQDGGAENRQNYRDYWHQYSFGDLTEVAKTRKSVLERLLPRLKIRDVAKIDGKFLIVEGKRHQYKIHIGSGNILIAPHDRYLCIVPGRGKDKNVDTLFLPFEGDNVLSIVLSKAFLLASDDKITDPTILSQL
jgi:hypothetical protein